MEVNSAPSIMAEHEDPVTAASICEHKRAMLRDMVGLVRHRLWRADEGERHSNSGGSKGGVTGSGRDSRVGNKKGGGVSERPLDVLDGQLISAGTAGRKARSTGSVAVNQSSGFVLLETG